MNARIFAAVIVFSACQLGPIPLEGLACVPEDDCGEGLRCINSTCQRPIDAGTRDGGAVDAGYDAGTTDAGPPDAGVRDAGSIPFDVNLLRNPGFEFLYPDGGIIGWNRTRSKLYPDPTAPFAGQRSLRLEPTSSEFQATLSPSEKVPGGEFGMRLCASAWARTNLDGGVSVSLAVRATFSDGGTTQTSTPKVTLGTSWMQLKRESAALDDTAIDLVLSTTELTDAGADVWFDEAWLSRASGACP